MEKQKYTKEEIETSKKMFSAWFTRVGGEGNYNDYLNSLLKPETKFIDVRIEYNEISGVIEGLPILMVQQALVNGFASLRNIKVTELSEMFTREEIKKMFTAHFSSDGYIEVLINKFLSERKSK